MAIQDISEVFIPNRIARLMKMAESEQTRYQYEIWFEYTRQTMAELKEGTFLAVKNFSTNQNENHHSILEIVSLMPIHYALGESPEGYPGFVMEAARNIATDWTSQEDRSEEDTTIIRCIAIPTGIEIAESQNGRDLNHDRALPMIGSDARVLTHDATREIVNREISPDRDHVFEGGTWLVDDRVPIYIRAEDFIRLHFGIFGFTGAGKSNFVSTYIANLLHISRNRNRPVKIVLFDLMSEYVPILIDCLYEFSKAYLVILGEQTIPDSTIRYLAGEKSKDMLKSATEDFLRTTLLPKSLESERSKFLRPIAILLRDNKVKIFKERERTIDVIIEEFKLPGGMGNIAGKVYDFVKVLKESYKDSPPTLENVNGIKKEIDDFIEKCEDQPSPKLTDKARIGLDGLRAHLEGNVRITEHQYPDDVVLSIGSITDGLNQEGHSSLYIIQSHDPDTIRSFAHSLGFHVFHRRRELGSNTPLVSFIFDEADEFIPQSPKEESYRNSSSIAAMLARRGRKFGLGLGIATQRVRYLDTSIMAQPHTYLVSKMPRLSDREAIQEAFGFSEDMFRQTFKFAPGDWLLASHDATGLKAVPIPIHAQDANERIREFLKRPNTTS